MSLTFDDALTQLAHNPRASLDVAEVALLLAQDEYPGLDVEATLAELAALGRDARHYVRGNLEARLRGLCRYLFDELGFQGNTGQYYDPDNSYLHLVLERRTGIPITLTVVAQAIGRRAGLVIDGIGLPGHFIARARDPHTHEQLLFDPFHDGRRLTEGDCAQLVQQSTGQAVAITPELLQPVPLGLLLARMLGNLKAIYLGNGDLVRGARTLRRLVQLQPQLILHRRDLGVTLVQMGQFGKALDHLDAYLRAQPHAADAPQVQQLLRQAQREVARWN